jgi:ankyrin repeat protein
MTAEIQEILRLLDEANINKDEGKWSRLIDLVKLFTDENGNVSLTTEQEESLKEADFDLVTFKQTLNFINRLSKILITPEKEQASLSPEVEQALITREEKASRVTALKGLIKSHYLKSKPISVQQLMDEEMIDGIARRYHKLKDKVEVEYLMLMNEDGETFVHQLFKHNAAAEDILFYLEQLRKHSYNIYESYFAIEHKGESVRALLQVKAQTQDYSKLLAFIREEKAFIKTEVNTHTASIHNSVNQSFVRLASQYIHRSFPKERFQICKNLISASDISGSQDTTIKIQRNKSWKTKINKDLDLFIKELKTTISILEAGSAETHELMQELYPEGYSDEVRNGVIFKCNKALATLEDLRANKHYGQTYTINPSAIETCGLSIREIAAISYDALQDRDSWKANTKKNNKFFSLVDGLYNGRRGYNIDKDNEEWKNPTNDIDDNRCAGGIVNALAEGLRDHEFVKIEIINADVVKSRVIHLLPEMLESLASQKDFQGRYEKSVIAWLSTSIIPSDLLEKLQEKFFEHKVTHGEYKKVAHKNFVISALKSIRSKEIKNKFDSLQISESAQNVYKQLLSKVEPNIDSFVRDDEGKYTLMLMSLPIEEKEVKLKEHLDKLPDNIAENLRLLNLYMHSKDEIFSKMVLQVFDSYKLSLTDEQKQQTFIRAIQGKDHKIVELLLSNMSPDAINAKDKDENTALHLAVNNKDHKMVELLLNKMSPAAINAKNNHGYTALYMAVKNKDPGMVELLLNKMSEIGINAKNNDGHTALHWAIVTKVPEIIGLLLNKMSTEGISAQNLFGFTALHIAVYTNPASVELLLNKMSPAAINVKNSYGDTALHRAVSMKIPWMVELLLNKMLPDAINAKNSQGSTALHNAVNNKDPGMVGLLLEEMLPDAINAKNSKGDTPLDLAVKNKDKKMVKILKAYSWDKYLTTSIVNGIADEALKEIIQKPSININSRDDQGCTGLMMLAKRNNLEMVKFFIESDAKIDTHGIFFKGRSALDYAPKGSDVERLLKDVQQRTKSLNHDFSKAVISICKNKEITDKLLMKTASELVSKQYKKLDKQTAEKLISETQKILKLAAAERISYNKIFFIRRLFTASPSVQKHTRKLLVTADTLMAEFKAIKKAKKAKKRAENNTSNSREPTAVQALITERLRRGAGPLNSKNAGARWQNR